MLDIVPLRLMRNWRAYTYAFHPHVPFDENIATTLDVGSFSLRLLGAPGWNLERGPTSNEEEGGKHIFWDYLRVLFIPMWDIRPHILGLVPLNGGVPWL